MEEINYALMWERREEINQPQMSYHRYERGAIYARSSISRTTPSMPPNPYSDQPTEPLPRWRSNTEEYPLASLRPQARLFETDYREYLINAGYSLDQPAPLMPQIIAALPRAEYKPVEVWKQPIYVDTVVEKPDYGEAMCQLLSLVVITASLICLIWLFFLVMPVIYAILGSL